MWRTRWTAVGEARFMGFLLVARRLSAQEGLMSLGFDSLSRATGVPKPSVQGYFGTTLELRSCVVEAWTEAVSQSVLVPACRVRGLRRAWSAAHRWLVLHREFAIPTEMLREGPPPPRRTEWEALRGRVVTVFEDWDRFLDEALTDARAAGELRPEADCRAVAEALVALTTGISARSGLLGAEAAIEQAGSAGWALLAGAAQQLEALPPRDQAVRALLADAADQGRRAVEALQDVDWLMPNRPLSAEGLT